MKVAGHKVRTCSAAQTSCNNELVNKEAGNNDLTDSAPEQTRDVIKGLLGVMPKRNTAGVSRSLSQKPIH